MTSTGCRHFPCSNILSSAGNISTDLYFIDIFSCKAQTFNSRPASKGMVSADVGDRSVAFRSTSLKVGGSGLSPSRFLYSLREKCLQIIAIN